MDHAPSVPQLRNVDTPEPQSEIIEKNANIGRMKQEKKSIIEILAHIYYTRTIDSISFIVRHLSVPYDNQGFSRLCW